MRGPFIFLRPEITRADALALARWMRDEEVTRYLSRERGISERIERMLETGLPVLTPLFNRNGRFYMVCRGGGEPVGFVRLVIKASETEIVVVIGERSGWGRRYGTAAIIESMKIVFFELRSPKIIAKIHSENRRSLRAFEGAGFKAEPGAAGMRSFIITMGEYIKSVKGGRNMNGDIYITKEDRSRLKKLIDAKSAHRMSMDGNLSSLDRELDRATLVESKELPGGVVSMNSRVVLDIGGEELEASLVYPDEACWTGERLSILSPIGTAILGYAEGARIGWEVPEGKTEIAIKKVLYQPEAAGDYHL